MTTPATPSILEFLTVWTRDNDVIKRSKIPVDKKILAFVLCASGYTSREASKILGGMSHVAAHDAYRNFLAALPPLEKKDRTVTIDENSVSLNPQVPAVIWLARDLDSAEILALRCSVSGSPEDGRKFIQTVLACCNERPLLRVGRGVGFPKKLRNLDLYFKIDTVSTTSIKQRISNFFWGTWTSAGSKEPSGA